MAIQNEMLGKLQLRFPEQILIVLCAFLLAAADCFAQESTPKPEQSAASAALAASTPEGPGSALSWALAAACSQNQAEFTRYLTVRNRDSFSRMTAAARVELMKRFVLLDEPTRAEIGRAH